MRRTMIAALAAIALAVGLTQPAAADSRDRAAENAAAEVIQTPTVTADESETLDGLTVEPQKESGATHVVSRPDEDTMLILTVIDRASAPTEYEHVLDLPPGVRLEAQNDGFLLRKGDDTVGLIGAPWAVDANGEAVETEYEMRGNTLVQIVHHGAGTAYPVVADPSFSLGWDWRAGWIAYWKFTRSETKDIAAKSYYGMQALTTFLCVLIPSMYGKAGCAALITYRFNVIRDVSRKAAAEGRCLWMVVPTTNVVANIWYFKAYNHSC